jgi:branched-chain amino acid aminotransferase
VKVVAMSAPRVMCYQVVGDHLVEIASTAGTLDELSRTLPQGVYTTLHTYPGGRALHVGDHLQRLADSAALLGHSFEIDRPRLRRAMAEGLQRSGFPLARLRVTVAFDSPGAAFVAFAPFAAPPEDLYRLGARAVTSHLARVLPRAKTTGFVEAGSHARAVAPPGTEEVLLVDPAGLILEGTTSNFFAVVDGRLRTAGEGMLPGITRSLVLEVAADVLPIEQSPLQVGELHVAAEAFLTSSSRGVMPVVAVDEKVVGAGTPGPVTRELRRRYEARVARDLEPLAA